MPGAVPGPGVSYGIRFVPTEDLARTRGALLIRLQAEAMTERYAENSLGTFNPDNNCKYPIRDVVTGQPLYIEKIYGEHAITVSAAGEPSRQLVEPYIIWENGWDAAKYESLHKNLVWELITEADIKNERERKFIGRQYGVKTYGAHKKGDLLGFYAGALVPKGVVAIGIGSSPPFLLNYPDLDGENISYCLDGDNIISRINTIFEYDQHGTPVRQASSGYNCDLAGFLVAARFPVIRTKWLGGHAGSVTEVKKTLLFAMFATEDIPAKPEGTELRWNCELSEESIREMIIDKFIEV